MRRAAAGAVMGMLILAAIAACSGRTGEAHPTPSWFTEREPLTSCGSVTPGPGSDATLPADALACLAAGSRDGAELAVGSYTTEGDLIVTYYRVGPRITGIDVVRDMTRDAFGPREWTREHCPEAMSPADLGVCEPAA